MFKKLIAAAAAVALSASVASAANIVQTAQSAGQFNTLLAAATAAGLVPALSGHTKLTVFAPTDAAFAKLPKGTVENLLKPENRDQLVAILTYHVVPAKVMSADIAGKTATAKTLSGGELAIDATSGVTVNDAKVVTADIEASNGVIHVVDAVILPPAN